MKITKLQREEQRKAADRVRCLLYYATHRKERLAYAKTYREKKKKECGDAIRAYNKAYFLTHKKEIYARRRRVAAKARAMKNKGG